MREFLSETIRTQQQKLHFSYTSWAVVDALSIVVAYYIALFGRTINWLYDGFYTLEFLGLVVLINYLLLYVNGAYKRIWRQTSGHGIQVLATATFQAMVIITVLDLIPARRPLPLSVVFVGQILTLGAITSSRFRSRLLAGLRWRWEAVWQRKFPESVSTKPRTLIVGAGQSGELLVLHHRKSNHEKHQLNIIGFADDDASKRGMLIEGKPVLGQTSDIPDLVRHYEIDQIILAIHKVSGEAYRQIAKICQDSAAAVKVMPDVFGLLGEKQGPLDLRDIRIEDLIGRPSMVIEDTVDTAPVTDKDILITGAAGSIGSELSRQFAQYRPRHLLLLDNNESGLFDLVMDLKQTAPKLSIIPILCDITNFDGLTRAFESYKPQVIFHAAAYKHVPLLEDFPHEAIRVNLGGTLNLARLAQAHHAERFVLISSDKAVNTTSIMGATKYMCELLVRSLAATNSDSSTLMTCVRFGNVLGSRGSIVPLFEKQIVNGGPLTVTDRRMARYFMSVWEAVHLVIQAACMTSGQDLFILEMGERVQILELAERMIQLHGLRPYIDIPISFVGIRPGESLDEHLLADDEQRQQTVHPSISKVTSRIANPDIILDRTHFLLNGNLEKTPQTVKSSLRQVVALSKPVIEEQLSS